MSRRIVLDTDMGSDVDDALCLALILASPELELVAVTTVGNEAHLRAQVARRLLDLACIESVPVFAGCRVPMLGGRGFNWFGLEGQGILEPGREPQVESRHAVDSLLQLSRDEPDFDLVAVGPMTNLAAALLLDPDFASRIRSLTIMGGHLRQVAYGGKVFPAGVDYNLCSDPEASYLVLRSGIPTTLICADVTLQTWIRPDDVDAIAAVATPFHRTLADAVRLWTPVQRRIFGGLGADMSEPNAAFLHDPLTAAVLYAPELCSFETLEIEPAIEGGLFRTFERPEAGERTFPMRCATAVRAPAVREDFMDRVLNWRPVKTPVSSS